MPHLHEKIDFTVEVFIVYKNKVLLRKHDKYKIWLSVGGHIELHEDPTQAAVREVKEEVGLDITLDDSLMPSRIKDSTTDLIPPYFLNKHRISDTHEHVTLVYFAKAKTHQLKLTQGSEKSEDCKWFNQKELLENKELIPNVRFYALEALRILGE